MDPSEWAVIAAAVAAIAWVNWYFFFAERSSADTQITGSGAQEVAITVKGGYSPAVIRAKEGTPPGRTPQV